MVEVIGELIDRSSLGGGVFDLGSATFDLTRILTGQLDAYVEPGARMVAEVPGMREEFARVGGGHVVNNSPYDLAAAALCLEEGGAVITDASGGALAPYRCSAPDRSSTSPAWRPVRPPSIGCLSRPWNGAWSACVRWISWPRLNPDQEGSPKCFSPSRWPIRAWPTTPTSSAARSSRRSASSPSR